MTAETLYVALPFKRTSHGHLSAQQARECSSSEHAAAEARKLCAEFGGAVAFSRSVDCGSGTTSDAQLILATGELPRLNYLLGVG